MKARISKLATAILFSLIPGALFAQWSSGSGGAIYYNGGYVGIGTASPPSALTVASTGPDEDGETYLRITNTNSYAGLMLNPGQTGDANWLVLGGYPNPGDFTIREYGVANFLTITSTNGYVGIGTTSPQHLLHVAGTIGAEEIIVSSTGADYVFDLKYQLAPLSEVASYVEENHHLPDIPSAEEMTKRASAWARCRLSCSPRSRS